MRIFVTFWLAFNMLIKLMCACKAVYYGNHVPFFALDVCFRNAFETDEIRLKSKQHKCYEGKNDTYAEYVWDNHNCSGNLTSASAIDLDTTHHLKCDDTTCDYVIVRKYKSDYPYTESVYVVGECYLLNNSWCSAFCTKFTYGVMCFDNDLCENDPITINFSTNPLGHLTELNYRIVECTNPESRLTIKTNTTAQEGADEWMIVGVVFITLFVIVLITSIIVLIHSNKNKKKGYSKTSALDADNEVIIKK